MHGSGPGGKSELGVPPVPNVAVGVGLGTTAPLKLAIARGLNSWMGGGSEFDEDVLACDDVLMGMIGGKPLVPLLTGRSRMTGE